MWEKEPNHFLVCDMTRIWTVYAMNKLEISINTFQIERARAQTHQIACKVNSIRIVCARGGRLCMCIANTVICLKYSTREKLSLSSKVAMQCNAMCSIEYITNVTTPRRTLCAAKFSSEFIFYFANESTKIDLFSSLFFFRIFKGISMQFECSRFLLSLEWMMMMITVTREQLLQ